ncbi:MAG TPA: histidinol-phosphate transaminase [Gammaproteobacteria bacterium]|nr:histidinol-phosphate transaminase [Gammaproteobacteria bacterium]
MDKVDSLVSKWVRPEIRALSAYPVPDATGYIKLDAMENPYTWPEELVGAWLERLHGVGLNRYPDPQAAGLKARLREVMALPEGMDLLLGNGSDEIIQMLALAIDGPAPTVLAPEPTFVMYKMISTFTRVEYLGVPLGERFELDANALLEAIDRYSPSLVYLAYPNNPTGNLFDEAAMETVIDAAPGLVVVDEAYHAFAGKSFMDRLGTYPNLLVMRTLSKLGLAGLRLGLLVGPPAWLAEFEKVRLPYNINTLTQVSAEFALEHHTTLDAQTATLRDERGRMQVALEAMTGVDPFPSAANFILFRVRRGGGADRVFAGLKERGVLIKNLNGAGGSLADCLRVTVGTPEENDAFLKALAETLDTV